MSLSAEIRLQYPKKNEGGFRLNVKFETPLEGITAIFGPSGSGKTSLLRSLAGLEAQAKGYVRFNNDVWQTPDWFLTTSKRRVGYVFQQQNLFPHLTGRQNINFALKRRKATDAQLNPESVFEILGIDSLLDRLPDEMSGGEQQLVAIARAVLNGPKLLLMDEALSSLDQSRKLELLSFVKELNRVSSIPIMYVSHSMDEVLEIADHVMVLDSGQLITNKPLMEALDTLSSRDSLWPGFGAAIQGTLVKRDKKYNLSQIEFPGGQLWVSSPSLDIGSKVRVSILARDISIACTKHEDSSILNKIEATINNIVEHHNPSFSQIHLLASTTKFRALVTQKSVDSLKLEVGDKVWMQIKSVAISH